MPEKVLHRPGEEDQNEESESRDDTPAPTNVWYGDRTGIAYVSMYAILALLGSVFVSGIPADGILLLGFDTEYYRSNPFQIPPQTFLYTFLGALTYVFTALAISPDVGTKAVKRFGIRTVLSLVLVVPVYYLFVFSAGTVPPDADGQWARQLVGLAFLVGLFVKHAEDGIRTYVLGSFIRLLSQIIR